MFTRPARPHHPADLHKSSQRISLRPTMFRAACDNSVTTSQPASPPTANLRISKCPRARPNCTKPDRADPLHCPTTARRPLVATHHDTPSIRTHLGGTGHAISTPRSRLSSLPPSPSVPRPWRGQHRSPPLTPTCRRSRPAPPTLHAHQPSSVPADDGDHYRVIIVRPGQPSAGPASHRPNVDPHQPFNHIQTADFHLDR